MIRPPVAIEEGAFGRRIGAAPALATVAAAPGFRGDGLRLLWSGVEIPFMRVAGAIPGAIVTAAAARNGEGVGRLRGRGQLLSWQAPGSNTEGSPRACTSDGVWLLEDGEDSSKWIKVQVYENFLPETADGSVYIADTYNIIGPSDITASQALAGVNDVTIYTLKNVSGNTIVNVKLWTEEPDGWQIDVSQDGINYYDPISEADGTALYWASIASGASVNVWTRRIIGGPMGYFPSVLTALAFSWIGY